jgi:hypothetical protein
VATNRRPAAVAKDVLNEIERRQRVGAIVEQVGQTVRTLLLVGGAVGIAWIGRLMVSDLAGKSTDANIIVDLLGKLEVSITLAWLACAGGVFYGISQNRLRKRAVVKLHQRIETLELLIDPTRTSSQLTERGDTNPRDT